jgi:hypothetical protein
VQLHRRHLRLALIALAATAPPIAGGCRNDGVILGSTHAHGGTGGTGGSAPGAGGGSAAPGAGGGSAAPGAGGSAGSAAATGGSSAAGAGAGAGGGAGGAGTGDGGVNPPDGGTLAWVDLSPCHFPATIAAFRTEPMAVLDPDRGKLVVYSGSSSGLGGYSDLWEVDLASGLRTDRTTCAYVDTIVNWSDALVYDAGRKRVVHFSSNAASTVREWDPVANVWTDRSAPSGAVPDGEARAALFDTTRGRAIVFISHVTALSNDLSLWEWDAATGAWTDRQTSLPMSSASAMPSLAFDAGRGVIWGFGGSNSSSNPTDRLWTWNVATAAFTDLTPVVRPAAWPSARWGAGLAYDGARGKLVLYGGYGASLSRRDLWEWDPAAATWANRTPPTISPTGADAPPGLLWPTSDYLGNAHLFADPARGRLVLLQNINFSNTGHSGAWLWDTARSTWSEPMADTPPALWPGNIGVTVSTAWDDADRALYLTMYGELWRWTAIDGRWTALDWRDGIGAPNDLPTLDGTALAYDPKARKVVLFGGYLSLNGGSPGALTDNLWLWDPAAARLSMVPRPAGAPWPEPRRDHALAYDPVRQQVLLFGGGKPEASRELWALDTASTTWRDLSGAAASAGAAWPEARMGHNLLLDSERNVLVLKGGGDTSAYAQTDALNATWELGAGTTSWSKRADAMASWPFGTPIAFVGGVGVVAAGLAATTAGQRQLWRWDGAGAAWSSLGVALPETMGYVGGLVGAGDRLILLWTTQDGTLPAEDQQFFHMWRWGMP